MSVVVIPENKTDDPWSTPGTYTRVTSSRGPSAIVVCPKCRRGASLVRDAGGHQIADDGTVSPSVVCPYDGCDWHVYVRLDGWRP